MQFFQRVPGLLRWILSVVLFFLLVMTISRFVFFLVYNPPGKAFSGSAFIMGLRFDARWACGIGLFMLIVCSIPFLNPFRNAASKIFWNFFLPLLFIILLSFYCTDFYYYNYLHQRLNASVLNFLQDAGISLKMMWESYPLVRIILGIIMLSILARIIFSRLLTHFQKQTVGPARKAVIFYIVATLLLAQLIIGKIFVMPGQFPLRWSDAYTLSDDFKANLALNPFQSFFSSLSFRSSGFDKKKLSENYALMSAYLDVQQPDSNRFNFERKYTAADSIHNRPNVVLVICESFSAYKSSMYGSPLNTTPYFAALCDKGIFFDRCFTPAWGTAKGVWATVTGIPDVEYPKTASRNMNMVDQHTIINDFKGYEKFYFLGGDPTWANIQGVLMNNIPGLTMYDGQNSNAKKIDVWGISDKNLLLEANTLLKKQDKPFFAIIQTADNHRPYTIPAEDREAFRVRNTSADSLHRYGFESNEEMNAFRYTDFCFQQFIESAKKEKYFDNTIFVFIGDHGIRGNAGELFPKSWTDQGLTCEHVPLLFYAPKLLKPERLHEVCSQVDVLPTAAALANVNYTNTTFGRNLFDSSTTARNGHGTPHEKYAFVFDEGVKTIGLVSNNYYYLKNLSSGKQEFVSVTGNTPVPATPQTDSIQHYLMRLTDAWYETARYLLLNNKKKQ